ncbi:phage holin family protein [Pantoea endophytica]|uniref:Phage holin family protein n=1 Tax=Pantoea sp. BJ2 TaxID=3141322 RepID=A0AAU7U3L7_9GAMM
MSYQQGVEYLNTIICGLICLRILFFQKRGNFHLGYSLLAYLLVLMSARSALEPAELSEVVLNVFICTVIWKVKGNIAKLAT